jgi:hypothetical protein
LRQVQSTARILTAWWHSGALPSALSSAFREDLHFTSVMLIGTDIERLRRAAEQALDVGLEVHVRPDFPDQNWPELLTHLERVAFAAEQLRVRYPNRVTLLVGSEFSHTAPGMVPGAWSYLRLLVLLRARWLFRRRVNRKLDALLAAAAITARRSFQGPVTYAAAAWEQVDWSRFDRVGVSLYRSGTDHAAYEQQVRALVHEHDKPVVITEFGCGAFVGADRLGPGSFQIVRWFTPRPRIRGNYPRDEGVQAAYLGELIDLYATTEVQGCFVFTFVMPGFTHHADPRFDLDKAGFGIVKIPDDVPYRWEPKEAFHEVARRYSRLAS